MYSEHIKKKKIVLKRKVLKIRSLIESTHDSIQLTKLKNELIEVSELLDRFKNMTVKKMRQIEPNFFNDFLIKGWAVEHGHDLEKLSSWRVQLLEWLESLSVLDASPDHDDSIRVDIEIMKNLARHTPFPAHRHFDQPIKNKWPDGLRDEVWWVLAKVTHKIEFEDKKTFYLFGVEVRETLRPSEIAELSSIPDGPLNLKAQKKLVLADQYLEDRVTVPDLISDLTPDERKLYNLLVEPHSYKTGQPRSLREIGERLGISHSTVRERQKKLMNAHEWTKPLILSARQGNSKKPHPNVLKPPTSKSMSPSSKQ